MSWRKTLYNLEDPKDLEELMEYFHSLDSDDEVYSQIQDAESLEVALIPPEDGEDSDQDDAASDDDIIPNTRDLGRADKQKRLKVQNRTSRKGGKRVKREWEEIILESRDQKVELLMDETRPARLIQNIF
nr:unnamed protein product [Callosobruchus chinensis]